MLSFTVYKGNVLVTLHYKCNADVTLGSCAALDTSAKLRFDPRLFRAGLVQKGEAGLNLHRGGNQLNVKPSDSFHFIGIFKSARRVVIPKAQSAFHPHIKRVVDGMERVTVVLLFAGCALTGDVYIIDMSLLIIAQLFLLRAIDSFKRSSRWGGSNEGRSPARIRG